MILYKTLNAEKSTFPKNERTPKLFCLIIYVWKMVCKEYITVQLIRSSVGPKRITKKNNSMYRIHLKALKMADFSLLHLNFIQTSGLISCGTDSHVVSSDRPQYFLSHLNFIQTSGLISCGTDSHVVSSDRPQYFLYAAILNQQSQSHSRRGFPLLL